MVISNQSSQAADNPQFSLGDKFSVFSDKAYRKGNKYFEAVGNVVIISQKDTVYGELASLDQETMMVKMEGNVRMITKDMTLYGSHLEYNIATGAAVIRNARIITTQFNLVATRLIRVSEDEYIAHDAEFTTCKDCAESWSVYGKYIRVEVGSNVQIRHGLAKIKGVNVLYIPYMVLPILTKRKSGLLFPTISQRKGGEGMAFEQPFFWAIDDAKDATITPTFWGKRGYGADFQYRQRFEEMRWMEFNTRTVNDTIYEPGKNNISPSGEENFRYFADAETHQQLSPNFNSHARYTGVRDLEIIQIYRQYAEPRVLGSDLGLDADANYRNDILTLGVQGHYLRNQLIEDPLEFDRSYVQTLPRVDFATTPYSLVQTKTPGFQHIVLGLEGSYSRFRQVKNEESIFLRNADRLSTMPYLMWHLFTWGPVSLKTRYQFDQQMYDFEESREKAAGKNAGLLRSEVSFTMDKVYGLAYEEKVPLKSISESELKKLRERKEQGLTPIQTTEKENRLVGDLPAFESELVRDNIIQIRNSFRHSQEFKFVHHYISNQNEFGNERFLNQIKEQQGWFDYEDARRSEEYRFGAAQVTRTLIPPENTVEFQWNNTLTRKSPKTMSYLEDDKFLRDNFNYSRIGYFNVSQGYLLNDQENQTDDYRDRLTRLMIETGYTTGRWSVALQEFYFHSQSQNIFNLNLNRRFDYLNIMASYRYSSVEAETSAITATKNETEINALGLGVQVRPTDILGLAIMKEISNNRDVRTIYSADIMPYNNCWIFNISHRKDITDARTSVNVIFNFGQAGFERYRSDYFGVKRL